MYRLVATTGDGEELYPANKKRPVNEFHPWRCENCGRYHYKMFPDEGCEVCKGENIARKLCPTPVQNNV